MRICVTGGTGFLGSAICNNLLKQGYSVIAFDNFSRKSHIKENYNYDVFEGDIRNKNDLQACITKYNGFDAMWHFAYVNGTEQFYKNPQLVLDVGVKGVINTLDVSLENKIKNYLLVSTSEVYNEPINIPTPESERMLIPDAYNPRFSYSGGKIISELMAIHYGGTQGLNIKIVRPHNVFGPNMGFEHVIPQIIKKIVLPKNPEYLNGKLIVNIQGNGMETRSFCFIDAAAEQISLVGSDSTPSGTYNIGIVDEINISNLVYLIAQILKIDIVIYSGVKPEGSSNRRCPDMFKMQQLGYIAKHDLMIGLKKTIDWYKNFYLKGKI